MNAVFSHNVGPQEERRGSMKKRIYFAAVAAAAMPFAAEANAGTPLIWGYVIHLVIGNLFIGIGEGLFLHLFAPQRRKRTCVLLMVCANYVSAWLGMNLLRHVGWLFGFIGIEHLKLVFWCTVALAWLFTIVAEAPFVWLALRGGVNCLRRVLVASVLVQSISYIVLFAWYACISETSLFSVEAVEDFSSMRIPEGVSVKFLDKDDRGFVIDLDSHERKETDPGELLTLATNHEYRVVKTVGEPDTGWKAQVGFWAAEGIRCHDVKTGRDFRLALETPFLKCYIRHVTQLPDGKLIFQLGWNLICIADPENKQVALLVRGRCPVVEMKRTAREGANSQSETGNIGFGNNSTLAAFDKRSTRRVGCAD